VLEQAHRSSDDINFLIGLGNTMARAVELLRALDTARAAVEDKQLLIREMNHRVEHQRIDVTLAERTGRELSKASKLRRLFVLPRGHAGEPASSAAVPAIALLRWRPPSQGVAAPRPHCRQRYPTGPMSLWFRDRKLKSSTTMLSTASRAPRQRRAASDALGVMTAPGQPTALAISSSNACCIRCNSRRPW
jgi:hypothetical protein